MTNKYKKKGNENCIKVDKTSRAGSLNSLVI